MRYYVAGEFHRTGGSSPGLVLRAQLGTTLIRMHAVEVLDGRPRDKTVCSLEYSEIRGTTGIVRQPEQVPCCAQTALRRPPEPIGEALAQRADRSSDWARRGCLEQVV